MNKVINDKNKDSGAAIDAGIHHYSHLRRIGFEAVKFLSVFLLGITLFWLAAGATATFDPEIAAIQNHITVNHKTSFFDGKQVTFDVGNKELLIGKLKHNFDCCRSELRPTIIILGASQLHTIIAGTLADNFTAYYANKRAQGRGANPLYMQISAPNANFNELLALYLFLRAHRLLPDRLVVAVVYDDFRETGVRREILDALPDMDKERLRRFGPGIANLCQAKAEEAKQAQGLAPAQTRPNTIVGSPQDRLELFLIHKLEATWAPYSFRHNLRSFISYFSFTKCEQFFNWLRRHKGYKPNPPIPQALKKWNLEALETLMALVKADGVPTLFYKAPHAQIPGFEYYNRPEFDSFFSWLAQRCGQDGLDYLDLETIIPLPYWLDEGTVDFFHFQHEGHKLLGAALDQGLEMKSRGASHALQ